MALTLIASSGELNTSSTCFKFMWRLYAKDTTVEQTDYYIYTYLKWVDGSGGTPSYVTKNKCPVVNPYSGASEDCTGFDPKTYIKDKTTLARMQHDWRITYTIKTPAHPNGYTVRTDVMELPDDNAKVGVVNTGHLHMEKNKWYKWGPPLQRAWSNKGAKVTITVVMEDVEGFNYPARCPAKNVSSTKTIQLPQYAVTPDKTTAVINGAWYNYNVTWKAAPNAKDYALQCSVNGGDWKSVTKWTTTRSYTPEWFRYAPGTKLKYRVVSRSSTGTTAVGSATDNITVGGGVKIKVHGTWLPGTVYIKGSDGAWHRAEYVATKQNDSWKISAY